MMTRNTVIGLTVFAALALWVQTVLSQSLLIYSDGIGIFTPPYAGKDSVSVENP